MTYYVQVNLIAPLNVQVYGHTLTFNLLELEYGSFPEIEPDANISDTKYSATPKPFVLVIISLIVVFICIILAVCIVKWRQKHSKPDQRFARNSVHKRHLSGVSACCQGRDWCYGSKTENQNDDHMFQKTNFNGFDTGEYEDMMINTTSMLHLISKKEKTLSI